MSAWHKAVKAACGFVILDTLGIGGLFGAANISQANQQVSTKTLQSYQFKSELTHHKIKHFSLDPSNKVLIYNVNGTFKHPKTKNKQVFPFMPKKHKVKYFRVQLIASDGLTTKAIDLAHKTHTKYNLQLKAPKGFMTHAILIKVAELLSILDVLAILGLAFRKQLFGDGSLSFFTKYNNKKHQVNVTFKDVAGEDAEKQELEQIVNFLKHPKSYTKLGAKIPHGILLEGPPGTGKTLLAKAVAGEAKVPFFIMSGSDFDSPIAGIGVRKVKKLFKTAKEHTPSIIFIDEIDALGRRRGNSGVGNDAAQNDSDKTLNQLLVEMDGFQDSNVIVIAATNRADVLDSALLRPGRFDRKIYVGKPDIKGREAILKVHAKGKPLDKTVSLKEVARQTPSFSGADLANLLNESALVAANNHHKTINNDDMDKAIDEVIAGPADKNAVVNPREEVLVAAHEAGHTVVGLALNSAMTVRKVTIVPHGRAGGYTMALPKSDQKIISKNDLMEQLAGLLGGRVAEEIVYHIKSTGGSNDFQKASKLARDMITKYGMSNILDDVSLSGNQQQQKFNYSEYTNKQVDLGVKELLDKAHQMAYKAIQQHRAQHHLITKALLKDKTLDIDQIKKLYYGNMIGGSSDVTRSTR